MSIFESVWNSLSTEFDLSECVYRIINGRVFIHFPKVDRSLPVRVKITKNALEDRENLYNALDSVIVAWLGNTNSVNRAVSTRIGPNNTCYCVINFSVINYDLDDEFMSDDEPIIDCKPPLDEKIEWDDDWDCIWEDEDDPESYFVNDNGVKIYKWTKNWAETFEDDFD